MHGGSASRRRGLLGRLIVESRRAPRIGTAAGRSVAARRARVAGAAGLCAVVVAWLAIATVGLVASQRALVEKERELARWESAYADLYARLRRDADVVARERRLEALRTELAQARAAERAAVEQFDDFRATVRRHIRELEQEFAALAEERDAAVDRARSLRQSLEAAQGWLRAAVDHKAELRDELALAEARATAVAEERDAARRESAAMARRAERLETTLAALREEQGEVLARLRAWVGDQVEALEVLFAGTDIDAERLIARAVAPPFEEEKDGGRGGPLRLALPRGVEVYTGAGAVESSAINGVFGRMRVLQRLLTGLPLAAPLSEFRVSSVFGERSDPFTRERAFHEGLDFVAARGAEVLATAPGRVVHAGPAGAYGNMVEIDHGLGVVTRYGHLAKVTVAAGDRVTARQPIGVIGSTGRSTGRHLHYEVRVEGEPKDPTKFLSAGQRLIRVFRG